MKPLFFKTGLGKNPLIKLLLKAIVYARNPIKVEGLKLYLPLSDGWDYINRPKFFHTQILKENLKEGDVVIDIGACIGFHTIIEAKKVGNKGKIIAFEADERNCGFLEKNIRINGFNNIDIINMAVSDKKGEEEFFVSFGSKYNQLGRNETTQNFIKIKTAFLDQLEIKPNFIKIDAMGSEAKIIRGAKKILADSKNLKIMIQYSPGKIKQCGDEPLEPLTTLKNSGFKILEINEEEKKLIEIKDIEKFSKEHITREIFCCKPG